MGTGSIGAVDVKFTANTSTATAAIDDLGARMTAAAAKAGAASRTIGAGMAAAAAKTAAAGESLARTIDRNTVAGQRLLALEQRQSVAFGRQAEAEAETARAHDLAALKADILSRANAGLAESSEMAGNSFLAMAAKASEAYGLVGEKIAATAEKAELSSDGIAAGFGGLSKILGAGILGEFAAHMLDNVAELNVQLEDLHEKTGMAAQDLAGLRLLALSKGLDFTTISMGLIRLGKAMYEARQGMMEDQEAFGSLGISMKEVQTDSVEQMFYRVSKALAENRSLVVADGTALELFGRGGKEMVPILRDFGGELQGLVKQQGALTGVTDQSAAAAQRWLQATQDLTAELHSALNPALVLLVEALPYLQTGFDALATGVDLVFGNIKDMAAGAIESIYAVGKAAFDASALNVGALSADLARIKALAPEERKRENARAASVREHALATDVAYNGLGGADLRHRGEVAPIGDAGYADGTLLKQAKQQLAEMEKQHHVSTPQLVQFWQAQLAKARPGSVDYQEINLALASAMQRASAPGRAKSEKPFSLGLTRRSRIPALEREGERPQREQARRDTSYQMEALAAQAKTETDTAEIVRQAHDKLAAIQVQGRLADIASALDHGRLTQYQAVLEQAQVRETATRAQLAELDQRLAAAKALSDLPGQQPVIAKLQAQRDELAETGRQQSVADQISIQDALPKNQIRTTLDKMEKDWEDMTSQIADTLGRTVSGLNEDIVSEIMKPSTDRSRGDFSRAVGGTLREGAGSVLRASLQKSESTLLHGLGFGGELDGSSEPNALWVRLAGAVDHAKGSTSVAGDTTSFIQKIFGGDAGGSSRVAGDTTSFIQKIFGGGAGGSSSVAGDTTSFIQKIFGGGNASSTSVAGDTTSNFMQKIVGASGNGVGAPASSALAASIPAAMARAVPSITSLLSTGHAAAALALPPLLSSGVQQQAAALPPLLPPDLAGLGPATSDFAGLLPGLEKGDSVTVQRPSNAAAAAGGSLVSNIFHSALSTLFQGAFAEGGSVVPHLPALVGERGPELFIPRSHGTIVPNHQIGGTVHHHSYSIDARGATDPAATAAAVHRAMKQALPQAVAASVAAVRDQAMRKPNVGGR